MISALSFLSFLKFVRSAQVMFLCFVLMSGPPPAAAQDKTPSPLYEQPVLVVDPGMHTAPINRADVDRSGRLAVTGSGDKTLRVWSLGASPKLMRTIRVPAGLGNVGKVYTVAMSPDGALVAAGGWLRWTKPDRQEQIYLFDRTGRMVKRIDGVPTVVNRLTFSPDGRFLVAGLGGNFGIRAFDRSQDWAEVGRDTDYRGRIYGLAFAVDGRLATTSYDGHVRLYDARFQRTARHKTTLGRRPYTLAFHPDGRRIAVGFADSGSVDLLDGRSLAPLKAPDTSGITNRGLYAVAWSRDGRTLFAGGGYVVKGRRPVVAWANAGRGARSLLFSGANDSLFSLKPLPDGELLVASGDPHLALLKADGTPRWAKPAPKFDPRGQRYNLAVSADGTVVEFGFKQWGRTRVHFDLKTLKLVNAAAAADRVAPPRQTGLKIEGWVNRPVPKIDGRRLRLKQYETSRSLAIHPDGKRFVLGAEWSLRAFDADGKQLWRQGVPGVVWAVNITGDGRMVVAAYGDGTIRWHRMDNGRELLAFMPLADHTNWVAWTPEGFYAATPGAHGVLQWHVNRGWDKPAEAFPISQFRHFRRPEVLPLVLQELETARAVGLSVMAKAAREVQLRTGSKLAPGARLHVLSVGVGEYNTKNAAHLRLKYADKDATDVLSALINSQSGLYAQVLDQVLTNKDATRKGVFDAVNAMRTNMRSSRDTNNTVVFMFSGHGALINDDYYLLPHDVDARNVDQIENTAIPVSRLRKRLRVLSRYGRVLVLLDACRSGAAAANGDELGIDGGVLRAQLAGLPNITVLTSSSSKKPSYEDAAWENGAFTEVFLRGLGRQSDTNSNNLISMTELATFMHDQLPRLTKGKGDQVPGMEVRFQSEVFASNL